MPSNGGSVAKWPVGNLYGRVSKFYAFAREYHSTQTKNTESDHFYATVVLTPTGTGFPGSQRPLASPIVKVDYR